MSVVIIGGNENGTAIQADLQKTQMQGEGIYKNVRKFEDTDWTARSDYIIYVDRST